MSSKTRNSLALFGIMLVIYGIAWLNTKNGDPNLRYLTVDSIWVIELPLALTLVWELFKRDSK